MAVSAGAAVVVNTGRILPIAVFGIHHHGE